MNKSRFREFILLHFVFPIADRIMGTCAIKWYKQIQQMNKWSNQQITDWQNVELQRFIKHAYEHTKYYRRIFDDRGLRPEDIQTKDDLQKLPIVTKTIVRDHFEDFVPDDINLIPHRDEKTGGTTGEPMHYYCDENVWGYVTAAKIYAWQQVGYHYGDAFIAFGSASLFSYKPSIPRRIYDKMRNEIALNSVNLTDELCAKYARIIQKKRVKFIYGYAASIYIFTKYIKNHLVDLTQIQGVFTTSENLTDEYRQLIQDTYQCHVMDCYGAKDAGITAYEVKQKHRYHVGYNVLAEIVDEIDSNVGTLLSTNIINYSFPLIRYQFGDEVSLLSNGYADYNGQVIDKVIGRTSDVLRLGNGHNLTSTGFAMIMKEFDIMAFEINKINDLSVELIIKPIKTLYTPEQEATIKTTICRYIGPECKLTITYVDEFQPLANGKRKYFILEK